MQLETLESRRLMSVSLNDGLLHISGTQRDDNITVTLSRNKLVVNDNGVESRFNVKTVSEITIDGYAGNDKLRLMSDQIPVGAGIYGGDGNDTIRGAKRTDWLYGGAGNDSIDGRAGADYLIGENGNDLLSGGLGDDEIHGDGGNDRLVGFDGNDYLDGGNGLDDIDGGRGDDFIWSQDGIQGDKVKGGEGNDSAVVDIFDRYGADVEGFSL